MRERIIACLFLATFSIASASSYAGWRLFGDHDKAVAAGVTIVGLIMFVRFAPTVRRR
jgi:hypothetical protein